MIWESEGGLLPRLCIFQSHFFCQSQDAPAPDSDSARGRPTRPSAGGRPRAKVHGSKARGQALAPQRGSEMRGLNRPPGGGRPVREPSLRPGHPWPGPAPRSPEEKRGGTELQAAWPGSLPEASARRRATKYDKRRAGRVFFFLTQDFY